MDVIYAIVETRIFNTKLDCNANITQYSIVEILNNINLFYIYVSIIKL